MHQMCFWLNEKFETDRWTDERCRETPQWWLDAENRFRGDDRWRGCEPAHLAAAELWVSTGQCFMG